MSIADIAMLYLWNIVWYLYFSFPLFCENSAQNGPEHFITVVVSRAVFFFFFGQCIGLALLVTAVRAGSSG